MPRFLLRTFGCKTNQVEAEGLRELLEAAGYAPTEDAAEADVAVISGCAVTQCADATCRAAVRRIHRENPAARIVLAGCNVDLDQPWVAEAPGIVLRLPNAKKHALADLLARIGTRSGGVSPTDSTEATETAEAVATARADPFGLPPLRRFADHARAFLKIQDGCANFCAYCTIPHARGAPRSRPEGAIREEATRLLAAGHGELVLTGIDLGAWRAEDGRGLSDLLGTLDPLPGLLRLRLSSLEPMRLDEALLERMAALPRVAPHLHLPLQSGDDGVLRAMGRRYTAETFLRWTERIRALLDRPGLTTDVIVGFPGETEEAFENTLRLVRAVGFGRIHVFPFSARPGTAAARMEGRLPQRIVAERRDRLLAEGECLARVFAQGLIGREAQMLVERVREGVGEGYTARYCPVRAPLGSAARGRLVRIRGEREEAGVLDAIPLAEGGACA